MISLAVFLLALLTVARVTRFITTDTLAQPFRDWVAVRFGPESKPADLIGCGWCSSIWVAAVVAPVAYYWGTTPWFVIVAMWLGVSWLYSIAASWLDED